MATRVDGVVVADAGGFRAAVKWNELRDPPMAIYYKVYARLDGEAGFKALGATTNSYECELITEVLKPGALYTFEIQPCKAISHQPIQELRSAPCVVRMAAAVPSAPVKLRANVEADAIQLFWGLPEQPNGVLLGFTVFYQAEAGASEATEAGVLTISLPPDQLQCTLRHLQSGTCYTIQICARTDAGDGQHTDILRATTLGGAVSRWGGSERPITAPVDECVALATGTITGREQPVLPDILQRNFSTTSAPMPKRAGSKSQHGAAFTVGVAPITVVRREAESTAATPAKVRAPRRRSMDDWQSMRREVEHVHTANEDVSDSDAGLISNETRLVRKTSAGVVSPPEVKFGATYYELGDIKPLSNGVGTNNMDGPSVIQKLRRKQSEAELAEVANRANSVKSSLKSISTATSVIEGQSDSLRRLYEEEHKDKIVVYITSLAAVRRTVDACNAVLKLFEVMMVKVQVKDVYISPRFARELEERLPNGRVPAVFIKYEYIGGLDEIVQLNDNRQLETLCFGIERRRPGETPCKRCGGTGFVLCTWCQGSGKSTYKKWNSVDKVLRCTVCSDNGLQKCPEC